MQPSAAQNKTAGPAPIDSLAGDVEYYLTLTPRQLPSRYLYDALGSALFEAICELPWYRITKTERALLERHAREIFARVDPLSTLVELGPGSGDKLAALISAGGVRSRRLAVHLVDISAAALDLATRTIAALEAVDLAIVPHQATYENGLVDAMAQRRPEGRTLTLFLGSNIGNFDPPGADAFLRGMRASLASGDSLLVGTDLVKPETRSAAGLRRSARRDGGVQPQPAGPHQSRARRRLRHRRLPPSRAVERRAIARRDAPRRRARPARPASPVRRSRWRSKKARPSGPRARTNTSRTK